MSIFLFHLDLRNYTYIRVSFYNPIFTSLTIKKFNYTLNHVILSILDLQVKLLKNVQVRGHISGGSCCIFYEVYLP